MTLHDFITSIILSIGTSGTNEIKYMKYTSEYIPKLQIHQHGCFMHSLLLFIKMYSVDPEWSFKHYMLTYL